MARPCRIHTGFPIGGLLPSLSRPAPNLGQVTHSFRADRCPGVLRMHAAADGHLARIRIPGGRLRPQMWTALAGIAAQGDSYLHLTSRGNVQVRGLAKDAAEQVSAELEAVGLGPSPTHDRMRNVLASPLAGRVAGRFGLGSTVEDTVAALVQRPGLSDSALSGKFLFGLDDASGDILRHVPDLGGMWRSDAVVELIIGGQLSGVCVDVADVPELLANLAECFIARADAGWRITGNAAAKAALQDIARQLAPPGVRAPDTAPEPAAVVPVGWVDEVGGAVSLLAVTEFARLDARLAEFLGAIETETTISPERVIGIHGLSENQAEQVVRVLAPMGLIFDATSPWVRTTACIGAPGCAKSLTDVHADLGNAISSATLSVRPLHWVGCERACGWNHTDLLVQATPTGYVEIEPGLDLPDGERA